MRARLGLLATTAIACGGGAEPAAPPPVASSAELTAAEHAQLKELSPLPAVPPDPTNAVADSAAAARLGHRLFFDPELSGPLLVDGEHGKQGERGRVSCHTCHDGPHLDDRRDPAHLSLGTALGIRNSPALTNSAFYRWGNWGGRFDSQWSLVLGAVEKLDVMNGNRLAIVHLLVAKYRADYEAVFPALDAALADRRRFPASGRPKDPAWETMAARDRDVVDRIFSNAGKAVAAYMRSLVSRSSAFDRFVAGDRTAISASAQRGAKLFLQHCKRCHDGPHFSDDKFHALAVAQFGPNVPASDLGRFDDIQALLASPFNVDGPYSDARDTKRLAGLARDDLQRGQFRTPTLRNIAATAPYMHAGQFRTLANVVAFYNAGGGEVAGIVKDRELKPLALGDRAQADLVEFMKTLSDEPLPAALVTAPAPRSFDAALVALRTAGLAAAADTIARRVAQPQPKLKLTEEQARDAAVALLELAKRKAVRALHAVMPRSTVELARAVRGRGVSADEADAIARYLVTVVKSLAFERLDVFDENHSHVTGREWDEIDYTGERMTWQGQRDDWFPKGVKSFKRAAYIHAYFTGAEPLPHWKRVYKPRGTMAGVAAP